MSEEKLIISVEKYPELWDINHAFYRDHERKNTIWEEIAKNNFVDKTGNDCKKKWFTLRDGFRRSLNKRKNCYRTSEKKIKPYRFEKQLQFLHTCFEERSQLANLDSLSESYKNEDEEYTPNENLATETRESVTLPSSPAVVRSLHGSISSCTSSHKITAKKTPIRAAEVLQSYLNRKPPSTCVDQLSAFFQSMELNVRSFPYSLQIEAKQKIFTVVTELERQALSSATDTRTKHNQILFR